MSGGSFDYECYRVEEYYCGRMGDVELNEMIEDFAKVLHDLEWWHSGDIGEEDYRETVNNFKKKWFKRTKGDIEKIIEQKMSNLKQELTEAFKYLKE